MSSFICEKCGKEILDTENGYITGCEHYPLEDNKSAEEKMLEWIDNASYEQLLRRWRFAPAGDPFFQGYIGRYYYNKMREKRKKISDEEHAAISKKIGWNDVE